MHIQYSRMQCSNCPKDKPQAIPISWVSAASDEELSEAQES